MGFFGKKEKVENFDHYKKIIESIIKEWKLDPNKLYNPKQRTWSLVQGSVKFFITIFNLKGIDYIEIAASIVKLPDDNLLPFYRKLLELNDYYIGIKLSIKGNQVWLLGQRECKGLDKGEAKKLIDNVRLIADDIDDKLMKEFSATK